jgi:hypothetical protein
LLLGCLYLNLLRAVVRNPAVNLVPLALEAAVPDNPAPLVLEAALVRQVARAHLAHPAVWEAVPEAESIKEDTRAVAEAILVVEAAPIVQHQAARPGRLSYMAASASLRRGGRLLFCLSMSIV